MFLSKRSSGIYYLWFRDDLGRKQKVSTKCKMKSDALKFLQQYKQNARQRREKLQRVLLSQFQEDFSAYSKSVHTVKTQQAFDVAFKQFIQVLGDMPIHQVGIRDIEKFLSKKKEEASVWTARKYYLALASAFETAQRWKCISNNPFRQVLKPKVMEVQPAYFSKSDLEALLKIIADSDFRELCILGVSTGLRLGEITSLQWTDIDFVRKTICVQNSATFTTKSKKNRIVPMTEQLWKLLAVRKERASCELVFHLKRKRLTEWYVSKSFKKYVRLSGVNGSLHFHSLRHTFASWLVQDGVSLYEVQKLLGHASSSTTEIYSHLQPEQMHDTVNRIDLQLN